MRQIGKIASEIIFKTIVSGKLGKSDVRQESPDQYSTRMWLIAAFKNCKLMGKCK